MQKGQRAGFKREWIKLEPCSICKGKAIVAGVFYELVARIATGQVGLFRGGKLVLSVDELVTQLSFKLQPIQREVSALKTPPAPLGPQGQYKQPNRLGAGATKYTGD